MSAEAPKQFSEAQLGFQRLLLPEKKSDSQPGEGLKRLGLNASIFVGATVADLAESHLVDAIVRKAPVFNRMQVEYGDVKGLADMDGLNEKQKTSQWMAELNNIRARAKNEADINIDDVKKHLRDAAQHEMGIKNGVEFMEEWGSDAFMSSLANGWVRLMTGVDGVKYVSETAAVIADWINIASQVFYGDKYFPRFDRTVANMNTKDEKPKRGLFGVKLSYKTMDFINPVNVEAALRVVEDVPVVGNGVAWLHEKTDHLLESTVGGKATGLAGKWILGFHIGKNVVTI